MHAPMVDSAQKKWGVMLGGLKREGLKREGLKRGGALMEGLMSMGLKRGSTLMEGLMSMGLKREGLKREGLKRGSTLMGGVPPNVAQTRVVDTAGAVPSPAAKWERVRHRRTAAHPNPGPPHRGTPYAYNRPNPHTRPQHERSNPHRRSAPGSATGYPSGPQSCPAASFSTDG